MSFRRMDYRQGRNNEIWLLYQQYYMLILIKSL